jgi:Fe-S-cluster containining protein
MLKETTITEIIRNIVEGNVKITDNSICGNCSKCGECCTNFLPVTQKEIDEIQKYVIKNNIRPQKQMLIMQNRLSCPYYDGKKCLIYKARPLICKEFYCYKKISIESAKKMLAEKRITVNMWAIAEEIDKYFKRSSL